MSIVSALVLQLASLCMLPGIAFLLRRMRVPRDRRILASFLLYGAGAGLASVFLWPGDLAVYVNMPGTWAGDWVYRSAIACIGDPGSSQAHYTIPWILRIPQVYAVASGLTFGAAGLVIQLILNGWRPSGRP